VKQLEGGGGTASYGPSETLAVVAIVMGVISILLGHSGIGANFGGMVTAAVVASFMGRMVVSGSGLSRRAKVGAVLAIVLLAIALCAGMAWIDALGRDHPILAGRGGF